MNVFMTSTKFQGSYKELFSIIIEQANQEEEIDLLIRDNKLFLFDKDFYAYGEVAFYQKTIQVDITSTEEIQLFNKVVLTTWWSNFQYVLEETLNGWTLSYEGAYNGLNAQALIVDSFILEGDLLIKSSLSWEEIITEEEYAFLKGRYTTLLSEGFSMEEALNSIERGADVLYKDEDEIKYLTAKDALASVR